jgi:heme-degrading monooxygenase HmoA
MIVRMSEAHVAPNQQDAFMMLLRELVSTFPAQHEGLLSHEVLVDRADPQRVIYVSRWRDEEAITGFAGQGWATDVVTFPDEDTYLLQPLHLRHFRVD